MISKCNTTTDEYGHELVTHGTLQFPIACYHADLQKDAVPWHWHVELEFAIVTKGEAILRCGCEQCRIQTGEAFFVNSEMLHSVQNANGDPCRLHAMVFHPRLAGGEAASVFWKKYVTPLITDKSIPYAHIKTIDKSGLEIINNIELAWDNCANEYSGFEIETRNAVSRLIFLMTASERNNPNDISDKSIRDNERVKTMLQYIHLHFMEYISITSLSNTIHVSERECLRLFHRTISMTPSQFIKQYRIKNAQELLSSSKLKIADIGSRCGFQDTSYFIKTFREMIGMTPSQYRKTNSLIE